MNLKIKENLGMLLLLATIVTFNVIIGAKEKGLRVLPISILLAGIVVFLSILRIKNKKQGIEEGIFFKSKVDYFVLAFMLITTLPLIFHTYVSYSDTVEFIMKHFFIYAVYILARNVTKDKRQINCIIVTTLISSLIPIFLHIDYLSKQYLLGFIEWLDIIYQKRTMFEGTFGYGNTEAIYSAFCIFLAIHRFKENKNKILKVIDVIYILFLIYIIWLAEAQTTLILLCITVFVYFVLEYKERIIKHKKKIIIGASLGLCIVAVYLAIALNTPKTIVANNEDIVEKIYYRFKQNTTYTLELDYEIQCLNQSKKDEKLQMDLLQYGKYFIERIIVKSEIDPNSNKYTLEFTPTVDTKYVKFKIYNDYYGIIKINNVCINGEKQIVEYKYIPNKIGDTLTKFLTCGKSLEQRFYMYKDSLKIAKDSPIIGNGGNTWRVVSKAVEEYKVALKETHSYFFELLINYGIVGVVAFLSLVIYFFIKIFKQCKNDEEKRKEKLEIVLGLFMILFHSITFDFHMAFMLIQILVYIYMAILLYDVKEMKDIKTKKYNIVDYVIIIFLVFILSLYIRADISKYLLLDNSEKYAVTPYKKDYYYNKIADDISNSKDKKEVLNELIEFINKEPYYEQTETYKMYFNTICESLDILNDEELNNYLNFGINKLKTIKFITPMYLDTIFDRVDVLANTINSLKEYLTEEKNNTNRNEEKISILNKAINELETILMSEYKVNIKNIEDVENGDTSKEARNSMKKRYDEIIKRVNEEQL